jgi:hypothetical protein
LINILFFLFINRLIKLPWRYFLLLQFIEGYIIRINAISFIFIWMKVLLLLYLFHYYLKVKNNQRTLHNKILILNKYLTRNILIEKNNEILPNKLQVSLIFFVRRDSSISYFFTYKYSIINKNVINHNLKQLFLYK